MSRPGRRRGKWFGEPERLERRRLLSVLAVGNLDNSGSGSLRAAIEQANLDGSGDTIGFASGLSGTIDLVSALSSITSDTVISGPGASAITVSTSVNPNSPGAFPIFSITAGATVTISGLTTMGGLGINNRGTLTLAYTTTTGDTPGFPVGSGGGINNAGSLRLLNATVDYCNLVRSTTGGTNAGGIYNTGVLTVENSVVANNAAAVQGAGIDNEGELRVVDSTISNNTAGLTPGNGIGGAIYNHGTATVVRSTLSGNRGSGTFGMGNGGGIYNDGQFELEDTAVNDNSAGGMSGGSGGGIDNTGTMTVGNSTIAGNTVGSSRDLAFGGGIANSGGLTVASSTISGNTAEISFGSHADGGGIWNTGKLVLVNVTASGNQAFGSGDAIFNSGSMFLGYATISGNKTTGGGQSVAVANQSAQQAAIACIDTILNSPGGMTVTGGGGGTFLSLGHNLFSDAPDFAVKKTDLINTDPTLGPLADNGGPTMTQALLATSPAINAGASVPGVPTDQRGLYRPQGAAPDIGAFELQLAPVVVSIVRLGFHKQPTALVITFSQPMDRARAEMLANYRLAPADLGRHADKASEALTAIVSATYDAVTHAVTLRPVHHLPLDRVYRLTIAGAPPTGLTDAAGLFLDGAGARQPGTNYVHRVTGKLLSHRTHPPTVLVGNGRR